MSDCRMPQGHPSHCGCNKPDSFDIARWSKRLVEQLRAENTQLRAQLEERDAAIEEWSGTAVQNGMECDRLAGRVAELEAVLGQQHEAHRKTWRQLELAQAELLALRGRGTGA